ncbi:hypothetical protein MLD38_022818 [Melastoma candidum]|uniref:Uncharacterized protein n=1 Tax=Melastoma candidum TaxID=119954 RepID=A0ACB9QKP7_9MYRT|nr:hypothetical protein MLD38_022818 [Melastoma candidum]
MEHIHGLLKIHVRRGFNLAVRDITTSDPYVVIRMGKQKLKTRVVKRNLNPEWNDHLTLSVVDPSLPIHLAVYDRDRFSADDKMGDADINMGPFVEALRGVGLTRLHAGAVVARIQPTRDTCLAEESHIVSNGKGGLTQRMILRLKNVESGEVELELEWIDIPGSRGL